MSEAHTEIEDRTMEIRERISFYMNRKSLPIVVELCEDITYLLEIVEDKILRRAT